MKGLQLPLLFAWSAFCNSTSIISYANLYYFNGENLCMTIHLVCFLIIVGFSLTRYRGYHDNTYPYNYSREYWHVIAARLAFVFAFQFIVYTITSFVAWVVPDTSDELKFKLEREKEIIQSLVYRHDNDSDATDVDDEEDDVMQFQDAKQEVDSDG